MNMTSVGTKVFVLSPDRSVAIEIRDLASIGELAVSYAARTYTDLDQDTGEDVQKTVRGGRSYSNLTLSFFWLEDDPGQLHLERFHGESGDHLFLMVLPDGSEVEIFGPILGYKTDQMDGPSTVISRTVSIGINSITFLNPSIV